MAEWLDDLHTSEQIVSDTRFALMDICLALETIGNYSQAVIIDDLCKRLKHAKNLLSSGISKAVDENYTAAMQSTSNMMDAVLMMCEREGEHEKELEVAREQEASHD